jgi:hypothetical protein
MKTTAHFIEIINRQIDKYNNDRERNVIKASDRYLSKAFSQPIKVLNTVT